MPIRAVDPVPVLPTLAQQKADFTAEGSPPPGKVATEVPETPDTVPDAEAHPVTRVRGTLKLKRPRATRHH